MVLDDEMEQAALKIQSTFRGHKSRKEIKPKADDTKTEESENSERNESAENLDDDIANMVLDDEMEQAALKIQSTFRGHKVRKDKQNENTETEQTQEEETEPEESKEEEQPPKQEEEPQSSTEKSAQQLQDEEDIANLVMDDKMEETALKIQSAFRGKFKVKCSVFFIHTFSEITFFELLIISDHDYVVTKILEK